jgi:hypothetical protein
MKKKTKSKPSRGALAERDQIKWFNEILTIAQSASGNAREEDANRLWELSNRFFGGGGGKVMEPGELIAFTKWLLEGLEDMQTVRGWNVRLIEYCSGLEFDLRVTGHNSYYDVDGSSGPHFMVLELIRLQQVRIARCAWARCTHPWFVSYKRSLYCSSTHAMTARKWRARHDGKDLVEVEK